MKRLIQTIQNIFSIEELRTRILYTLGFLVMFRLGSFIVLPGIDISGVDKAKPMEGILIIGNESNGISSEIEKLASEKITIPRIGHAESLNAAIATAIVCHTFLVG